MDAQYNTEKLDHLGIVAGICDKISLVENVDSFIEKTKRNVSVGEAVFNNQSDALCQINEFNKKYNFHNALFEYVTIGKNSGKGRPKNGEKNLITNYKLKCTLEEDQEAVEKIKASKGKFVLATNNLDEEKLSVNKVFSTYKSQGVSVERGFRFLKEPMFFAHSLFLKKPERIMPLIMTLSLLVYSLAEH